MFVSLSKVSVLVYGFSLDFILVLDRKVVMWDFNRVGNSLAQREVNSLLHKSSQLKHVKCLMNTPY